MHVRAGVQSDLENLVVGQGLRQRGTRAGMHQRVGLASGARVRAQAFDQFLIFIVD